MKSVGRKEESQDCRKESWKGNKTKSVIVNGNVSVNGSGKERGKWNRKFDDK